MKINNDTHFPHPVLNTETDDFLEGVFNFDIELQENIKEQKLTLQYEASVVQPDVQKLLENGRAAIGVYVTCRDTYYQRLLTADYPKGQIQFPDGYLRGTVRLRPLIWLREAVEEWRPENLHKEFGTSVNLPAGEIIGIDEEIEITVGNAKLAPIESIFKLVRVSEEVEPGHISVVPDSDKIEIQCHERVFDDISSVREQSARNKILFPAVYLPAVMQILSEMASGGASYEDKSWFEPFKAKCIFFGIDINNPDPLSDAQKLLKSPIEKIKTVMELQDDR